MKKQLYILIASTMLIFPAIGFGSDAQVDHSKMMTMDQGKEMAMERGEKMGMEHGKKVGHDMKNMGMDQGKEMAMEKGEKMGMEHGKKMGHDMEKMTMDHGKEMAMEKGGKMGMEHGKNMGHDMDEMDHHEMKDTDHHDMGKMDHGDMKGMDHLGMSTEGRMMMLGTHAVDGIKGMAHLNDVREKMAEHGMTQTHHIMIAFENIATGDAVESGSVAVKIEDPDEKVSKAIKLMGMDGHYGVDVTLNKKGMYHFKFGTKLADGKKRTFHHHFENK